MNLSIDRSLVALIIDIIIGFYSADHLRKLWEAKTIPFTKQPTGDTSASQQQPTKASRLAPNTTKANTSA